MEKFEEKIEKSFAEKIREIIEKCPESIQREFNRTDNSWPSCLLSSITAVNAYLSYGEEEGEISEENYKLAKSKIDLLTEKIKALQKEYPRGKEMSEDLRSELLAELNQVTENL